MRTPRRPSVFDGLRRAQSLPGPRPPIYSAPPAVRAFHSADQNIANGTLTDLLLNSERWDTDTMHFTTVAALTGTVSKTAGGNTLTGAGTTFTTQLSVGQAVDVPGGGGTERAVVTDIASNTVATVAVGGAGGVWAFTAGGQTATRVSQALVANTPGLYAIFANVRFASNATGNRQARIVLNGGATICSDNRAPAPGANPTDIPLWTEYRLAQYDFVTVAAFQSSGGTLAIQSVANFTPEFGMSRVGPA